MSTETAADGAGRADARYAAVSSRDSRFDGRFVTAVLTTGIYCRPSCPARTPMRRNVRFYAEPAAAEVAGFRACKRCRPDRAPDSPDVDVRGDLVGRALRLIATGTPGGDSVAGLARSLAVSERHLHRVFVGELGAGPQAVVRSRRVRLARGLLEGGTLGIGDVAFASGFGSLRQFNEAMKAATGLTPSEIRAATRHQQSQALSLRLGVRAPYDTGLALRWISGHAVPGVEEVHGTTWRRTVPGGVVTVTANGDAWILGADIAETRDIAGIVRSARRVLDLDADPQTINAALSRHHALAPLVAAKPGLRCLGSWGAFEGVVRIVLGQQVSVRGGALAAGRLARVAGTPLPEPVGTLTHVFPTPRQVVDTDLGAAGLTRARGDTVRRLAAAALDDGLFDPAATPGETLAMLATIKGVGPWTLACAQMRVLRDPDSWPAGDLILRRACARHGIDPDDTDFSPWHAYAATHLWEDIWTPPV